MKRILNIMTISLLTVLTLGGMYFPTSPVMFLASVGEQFTYVRLSIMIILLALLFYKPPRTTTFRLGLVAVAVALGVSTVSMINNYTIMLFDALIFAEVSILLLIEAAELKPEKIPSLQATERRPKTRRTIQAA